MQGENTLFQNAHGALVFAYNFAGQAYDRPMMNRLAAPSVGNGKGLVGLDGAAQSGMIRAEVQCLGKLAEAILIARTAPKSKPCSCRAACCSGHKPNREWTDAIATLSDHVRTAVYTGCSVNGLMRREYLVRFFTQKADRVSLDDLAERYDINRNTVSAHYSKLSTWLAGIPERKGKPGVPGMEELAWEAVEARLREVHIVGDFA